jgi:hypothetical protein
METFTKPLFMKQILHSKLPVISLLLTRSLFCEMIEKDDTVRRGFWYMTGSTLTEGFILSAVAHECEF